MKANCTICCDLFDDVVSIAATTCGHTFHELCLLQWLEHSRTCPACRKHITQKSIIRLFFTVTQDEQINVDQLKNNLDTLKADFKVMQMEKRKMQGDMDELRSLVVTSEARYEEVNDKFCDSKCEISSLKIQLKSVLKELTGMEKVKEENLKLKDKLHHFQNVQTIINGCEKDITDILQNYGRNPAARKQMATYCALLKRELHMAVECKRQLREELKTVKKELVYKSILAKNKEDSYKKLEAECQIMKERLDFLGTTSQIQTNSSSCTKRKLSEKSNTERFALLLCNDTIANTLPTPTKRLKINFISSAHSKPSKDSNKGFSVQSSFFKPKTKSRDDSVISVGYNGMGGHSRHIVRHTKPISKNINSKKALLKENISNRIGAFPS